MMRCQHKSLSQLTIASLEAVPERWIIDAGHISTAHTMQRGKTCYIQVKTLFLIGLFAGGLDLLNSTCMTLVHKHDHLVITAATSNHYESSKYHSTYLS